MYKILPSDSQRVQRAYEVVFKTKKSIFDWITNTKSEFTNFEIKKIFLDTGIQYSLDHVERAMFLEGLLDAKDVFQPNVKREEYGY